MQVQLAQNDPRAYSTFRTAGLAPANCLRDAGAHGSRFAAGWPSESSLVGLRAEERAQNNSLNFSMSTSQSVVPILDAYPNYSQ
jgi:hypothetical protein